MPALASAIASILPPAQRIEVVHRQIMLVNQLLCVIHQLQDL